MKRKTEKTKEKLYSEEELRHILRTFAKKCIGIMEKEIRKLRKGLQVAKKISARNA